MEEVGWGGGGGSDGEGKGRGRLGKKRPVEGSTMMKKASWQACISRLLCKSVYFNTTATAIWFVTQSFSCFPPSRASYFHAFESHSRTCGAFLPSPWRQNTLGSSQRAFDFLGEEWDADIGLTLIPDSSCLFIIQPGKIFLETAFRWLQEYIYLLAPHCLRAPPLSEVMLGCWIIWIPALTMWFAQTKEPLHFSLLNWQARS